LFKFPSPVPPWKKGTGGSSFLNMRSTGINRIRQWGKRCLRGIIPETTKRKLLFNPGRFAGNVSRGFLD
jgi:hypothetical protein